MRQSFLKNFPPSTVAAAPLLEASPNDKSRSHELLVAGLEITNFSQHCPAPLYRALVTATKATSRKEPTT